MAYSGPITLGDIEADLTLSDEDGAVAEGDWPPLPPASNISARLRLISPP